jgi:Cdc6-like AAA superfamily ATPase
MEKHISRRDFVDEDDSDSDSYSDGDETNTTTRNVIKITRGIKNADDAHDADDEDDIEKNIIISSDIHIVHRNKNENMLVSKQAPTTININGTGTNNSEFFKNSTPWVEKYRPSCFEDIVLDPLNKTLLKNIIDNNYFPNLLFYGPPGTGKTTTIINLVNVYQEKMNLKNKGLMIHLNASDERGIDIIRNQINSFVNSKSLFGDGMKFVIILVVSMNRFKPSL